MTISSTNNANIQAIFDPIIRNNDFTIYFPFSFLCSDNLSVSVNVTHTHVQLIFFFFFFFFVYANGMKNNEK